MSNEFKAGDFTSGKMGDIYKECYRNELAVINHKQFGKAYLIPEQFLCELVVNNLHKNKKFKTFIKGIKINNENEFFDNDSEELLLIVESYFKVKLSNWVDATNELFKAS